MMENRAKPHLVMIIEPENKFRFRYDSEKNSHGGVIGKGKTNDGKKTHPTIQLVNYYGKEKVYIRVSLYTLNDEKHVLEIKGKNAKNGMYYEDLNNDFTATFTCLAIMSKKKEEIIRILMDKKMKNMGHIRGAAAKAQLEKKHETEVKENAKEIMNSVKLCFEAFTEDDSTEPICPPLFSGPIYNQKCSEKGTLKIHHLSHYSGSWRGDDTVILLCDKVQKGKIKVHFYEMDDKDDEICKWEQDAKFSDADVHYQVAIKFQTPPFRGNIEKEVYVCLVRDDETSNSVHFLYKSDKTNLLSPSKKRKWNLDLESKSLSTQQCTYPENTPSPSSSSNDYSSDNHMEQLPPALDKNYSHVPQFNHINLNTSQITAAESFYPASVEEIQINNSLQYINGIDGESSTDMAELLEYCDVDLSEEFHNQRENPETSIASSFSMLIEPIPEYAPDGPTESQLNMSLAAHGKLEGQMSLEKCMSNLTLEGKGETVSLISPVLKCMKQNRTSINLKDKPKEMCLKLMSMRDESDNSLLHVAIFKNKDVRKVLELSKIAGCDIVNVKNHNNKTAMHIATEKNDCRILGLLLKYGGNSNLKDENGNGCLHIAAENDYFNCMKEIFSHGCYLDVNAFNYQGLTPLLISVMKGSFACVELLIKYADVNVVDKKSGRSPLHFAVDMQPFLLPTLLRKDDICIDIQDFGGNTPLHLASVSARVDCMKQLLEAGADPLKRNSKQNCNISNVNPEIQILGETAIDVAANLEIKELLQNAIEETPDSVHSDILDDTVVFEFLVLDPVTEEILCQLLDPEKYKNLAECIGMDICFIDKLIKLNPNPTQQIFKYLKKEYKDKYIDVLKNSLEIAGLDEALKIIKERQY